VPPCVLPWTNLSPRFQAEEQKVFTKKKERKKEQKNKENEIKKETSASYTVCNLFRVWGRDDGNLMDTANKLS